MLLGGGWIIVGVLLVDSGVVVAMTGTGGCSPFFDISNSVFAIVMDSFRTARAAFITSLNASRAAFDSCFDLFFFEFSIAVFTVSAASIELSTKVSFALFSAAAYSVLLLISSILSFLPAHYFCASWANAGSSLPRTEMSTPIAMRAFIYYSFRTY